MRIVLLVVMGLLFSVSCAPKEKSLYDWNELRNAIYSDRKWI